MTGPGALTAALLVATCVTAGAEPGPTPTSPSDSAAAATTLQAANLRAAYQNAWAHRQAGDSETTVIVGDAALREVNAALARDIDMPTRRDLTDLKSRLEGLRSAASKDLASAASARATGNEPDEKVLNAPAIESIEPQINPDVMKWVEFFNGNGRSTFERWLKRSGRYMSLFRSVLKREGLPEDLVHLVFVESGFNVKARSVSNAVGPWQFLRSTGTLFGLTVNQWVDERRDPEKSTVAAARYLKHLYAIFGDWPLALASYNAGEGTVMRAIKAQGTSNYWDLRLPRQTEDYVPQFMAILTVARDPEKYGFDAVQLDDPMEFDAVALKGAVDLRALARLAECEVEELQDLNPQVLRHAAQGRDGITTLRVPPGKGENLMKKLQEGEQLPAVSLTLKHTVRRGETLQSIARAYHVNGKQLALSNGIGKKRPLRRGMVLTVPSGGPRIAPALLENDDPRAATDYVPKRSRGTPKTLGAKSTAEGRMTITVKKGETLASIADRVGVTVADLKRWNRLKSNHVKRGTRLKVRTDEIEQPAAAKADPDGAGKDQRETASSSATLAAEYGPANREPSRSGAAASRTSKPRTTTIVVRRGDTLSTIARRHGVSVGQLKRVNGMTTESVLRRGQKLKLPVG
jgi:membrane-bound lytic murein transglycosylase D